MALTLDGTNGIVSSGSITTQSATGVIFSDSSSLPAASSPYVLKNRIINGDMRISQRNTTSSVTPASGDFTLDRWSVALSQASKFTVQQNAGSVTPPVGFSNYLGITSSSAYSITSGDFFYFRQPIEGFNTADLAWGTANAKTVTLSFQVYSSLTGTFGGSLENSAYTRNYPFSYSIPTANTWTTISITIAGDTSGTWVGATNGVGLRVNFGFGVGSTYSGTAGAWAAGDIVSATGATSVVGTNGATFYLTGVQLEIGTSATPFERRLYNQELANCQRYYYLHATGAAKNIASGGYYNATNASGYVQFPVQMRATPSTANTTGTNYYVFYRNGASDTLDSLSIDGPTQNSAQLYNNTEVSGTAGHAGYFYTNNASSVIAFTSEL